MITSFSCLIFLFFTFFHFNSAIASPNYTESAVSCETEADFLVFDQIGCRAAVFGPIYTDQNVLYQWDFGDPNSPTDLPSTMRTKSHEYSSGGTFDITLTVFFLDDETELSCTQSFTVDCTDECDDLTSFSYEVDETDCYKYIFTPDPFPPGVDMADLGSLWWHRWFVDGVEVADTETLCYTFPEDGVYEVEHWMEFDGITFFVCSESVLVNCEVPDDCSTASFDIDVGVDKCGGGLNMKLTPECLDENCTHTWTVSYGTVSNTYSELCPSITFGNFSTYQNNTVTVEYTLDCEGSSVSSTQTYNFDNPANTIEGIFIEGPVNSTELGALGLFDIGGVDDGLSWVNRNIFIKGILEVDQPTAFIGCDVTFVTNSGVTSGIDVLGEEKGNKLTVKQDSWLHSDCCLWRGIRLFTGTQFIGNKALIEDALYALEPAGNGFRRPHIDLQKVRFSNNYIGIKAANFDLLTNNEFQQGRWSQVIFNNNRSLKEFCGLGSDFPYPRQTVNGFAGIFLGNLTLQEISGSDYVHFSDLANGIVIDNSDVRFFGMSFANILSTEDIVNELSGYGEESGSGIRFLDGEGHHTFGQSNGTWFNCREGISLNSGNMGTRANVINVSMNKVSEGVTFNDRQDDITGTNAGQFILGRIVDSSIAASDDNLAFGMSENISHGIGVFTTMTDEPSSFEIINNIVNIDQSDTEAGNAAGIILSSNPNIENTLLCEGNTVNVNRAVAGIQMNSWTGEPADSNQKNSLVFDNDINLLSSNYNNFHQGIQIQGSTQSHFICNDVVGVNSDFGNGISFDMSPIIELAGNIITDIQVGISVKGSNIDADIRFNEFAGNQENGIVYSTGAVSGTQINRGNRWSGTYPQFGAVSNNSNPNIINMSRYEVPPSGSGIQSPTENTNCGSCEWFDKTGPIMVIPTCQTMLTDNLPDMGPPDECCAHEALIIEGTGLDYLDWELHRYLYKKLTTTDFPSGNESIEAFQLESASGKLGLFRHAQETILDFYKTEDVLSTEINALALDLEEKLDEIALIDAILSENPDADDSVYEDRITNANEAKAIYTELKNLTDGIRLEQKENAFSILPELYDLTSDTDYEANERALMLIFVDMTKRGYRLPTTVQKSTIKSIAEMCPQEGGSVVYWARTWYRSLANDLQLPEDCDKRAADERKEASQKTTVSNYAVYPNPVSQSLQIRLDALSKAKQEIRIYDFTGKQIKLLTVNTTADNAKISVADLPNGLYRLTIVRDAEQVYYESIVVIH